MNCSKAFDNLAEEDLWRPTAERATLTTQAFKCFIYFAVIIQLRRSLRHFLDTP